MLVLVDSKPALKLVPALKAESPSAQVPATEPEQVEPGQDASKSQYYELRDQIIQEMDAGRLDKALRLCDEALRLAEHLEDEELVDQIYCHRYRFALTLGCPDEPLDRLRAILMRNRSSEIGFWAAYSLSHAYVRQKQFKKALFYAQISRDRARAAEKHEFLHMSHHQIGYCLDSESYFEEAVGEYNVALSYLPAELSVDHTAILCNLGYAKFILGDSKSGFRCLFRALRWCIRHPEKRTYLGWIHIYLCYGYIEKRRWCHAWRHGIRGLEIAEKMGDYDAVKNSLYLLGDIEKSVGDIDAARDYFSRLQQEFYPDNSQLPDMMLLVETKKLVNLRA